MSVKRISAKHLSAPDTKFGLAGEKAALGQLRRIFGEGLEPTGYYDRFDFYDAGKNLYVELKTRRIAHDRYDTTIVPHSKLQWARRKRSKAPPGEKPRFVFAFAFTDGLYWVETPFEYTVKSVRRRDRSVSAPHALIAVDQLRSADEEFPDQAEASLSSESDGEVWFLDCEH